MDREQSNKLMTECLSDANELCTTFFTGKLKTDCVVVANVAVALFRERVLAASQIEYIGHSGGE